MFKDFDQYQELAMTTRTASADEAYALLGLSGEVGEVHSLVAKQIRDQHLTEEELKLNLTKELGDVLWFIAAIADDFELSLSEIAQANIEKLKKRKASGTIQGSGDNR
jgi:NTP pyrophosphatase (non-canonical NTP hydrolase)